jgi:hypothetical protein
MEKLFYTLVSVKSSQVQPNFIIIILPVFLYIITFLKKLFLWPMYVWLICVCNLMAICT